MIKKFVSNALLSMVMDKSARKKLATMRGDDEPTPKPASGTQTTRGSDDKAKANPIEDAATAAEDLAQTIEMALADARAEAAKPQDRKPQPRKKASPFDRPAKPMTPTREQLIRDAISIHQQKSKVLDSLDPAVREKLTAMALMALDPGSIPDGDPVDDIGGGHKKPPKRR